MNCKNCNYPVSERDRFCKNCGSQVVTETPAVGAPEQGTRISENITLGPDGKYRWRYDVNLIRSPHIFWLIWRIFFFILIGIFGFIIVLDLIEGNDFDLLNTLKFLGYFMIGMTVLVGVSYFIYAAIMGFRYSVIFVMDEEGIDHQQIASQAKKARRIGQAATVAGAAKGNFTMMGVGINSQRTSMYSSFSGVKKVKAFPRKHLIKVNATLDHNQVYAAPEDFEFVKNYIVSRCPNLKK